VLIKPFCLREWCAGFRDYPKALFALQRHLNNYLLYSVSTAAARVRCQVKSCGICGGRSGTGAGFYEYLGLPIFIPPTAPHSSSPIIRGWHNRPISGRRTKWIQSHPTPKMFCIEALTHWWSHKLEVGEVIDESGGMLEWWLTGENWRNSWKICFSATSSTTKKN
jgi:hypothetical protein